MSSFWGMKILCVFSWGHSNIGLFLGVNSM